MRLSAVDAFFVAYQEASGVLMTVGAEATLSVGVSEAEIIDALTEAARIWPTLTCGLRRAWLGLRWRPAWRPADLLRPAEGIDAWRNAPIDPFVEPPFQIARFETEEGVTLALRAHHAALDGQALYRVTATILRHVAARKAGRDAPEGPAPQARPTSPRQLLSGARLGALWGYSRWLTREATAGRSARLALEAIAPGDLGLARRIISWSQVQARAAALGCRPTPLLAAAWARALHAARPSEAPISLEIPISLRQPGAGEANLGNLISPLTLFIDGGAPLEEAARGLQAELGEALRRKLHHAVPLLAWPGRFLPYAWFRRIALTPSATGFATSHFTTLAPPEGAALDLEALSDGAVRLVDRRVYTPVCLHMGVAVLALPYDDQLQLALTYRRNALSEASAEGLLDRLVEGLSQ